MNKYTYILLIAGLLLGQMAPIGSNAQSGDCVREQGYYLTVISTPQSQYPDNLKDSLLEILKNEGYVEQDYNLVKEGINCFISIPVSGADGNEGMIIYFYSNSPNGFPQQELDNIQESLKDGVNQLGYVNLRVWIMKSLTYYRRQN